MVLDTYTGMSRLTLFFFLLLHTIVKKKTDRKKMSVFFFFFSSVVLYCLKRRNYIRVSTILGDYIRLPL